MRLTTPRLRLPSVLRHPGTWVLLTTLASVEFARGALFIAILPLFLPEQRGLGPAAVGLVISAQYLADITFKTLGGAFNDRYGPWPVLIPALSASALAAALIPHATGLAAIAAFAFVFGIGTAGNWPAVVTGVTRLAGETGEGTALSLIFIAWLGGGGAGPVLSSFLVGHGYTPVFRLITAVAVLGPLAALVALLARFPPRPVHTASGGPHRVSLTEVWQRLKQARLMLPGIYLTPVALGILLPVAMPFARQVLGLPHAAFGWLLLSGGGATMVALPLFGALTDRIGYRWLLVGGLALAGVATLWLAAAHTITDVLERTVVLGFAYAAILPAWTKLLVRAVPESVRGTFMGLFMAVEGLGVGTGPTVGGLLWSHLGPRAPFQATALIVLLMAGYYLLIPQQQLIGEGG